MAVADALSPLGVAALALLGDGASRADLVDLFEALGARIDREVAGGLLDQLAEHGLARVGRGNGADTVFVPTSLGRRLIQRNGSTAPEAELLRDLETMRSDLLATVAHELRTPLTAIRTCVGLLRDPESGPSREQRDRLLETIERNADRMQRFVGDSLDLTRFRAGRIQLQLRRFDAVDLARAVVESMPAGRERLELAPGAGPIWVFGDRRRLEHALVNLVSNALKYSPIDAPVNVAVDNSDDFVMWHVVDRGPGILESDRPRLFERFFVGRRDEAAAHEGVGLGLPISLAIVQAHEGTIEVDSEVGRGSRFTIHVPQAGPRGYDEP